MPKRRNSHIGTRSTYYSKTANMWVLQTLDNKGNKVVGDQYLPSKKQAEAWVKGNLKEGNCYEIAAKLLFCPENNQKSYTLCHGTAVGQGPIEGAIFGHAWLEYQDHIPTPQGIGIDLEMVLDHSNGKKTSMPKELYYKIGRIRGVKKYSKEEARKMLITQMTYGPWEETDNKLS